MTSRSDLTLKTTADRKDSTLAEILVVDDRWFERQELWNRLREHGFQVLWHTNWKEMAQMLQERQTNRELLPDVALVDIHFDTPFCTLGSTPSTEGILIVRWLKDNFPEIPSITYTVIEKDLDGRIMEQVGAKVHARVADDETFGIFAQRLVLLAKKFYWGPLDSHDPFPEPVDFEWQLAKKVVSTCGGVVEDAAKYLGLEVADLESILTERNSGE